MKPAHIGIGTIGHIDYKITTLSHAIEVVTQKQMKTLDEIRLEEKSVLFEINSINEPIRESRRERRARERKNKK